MANSTLTNLFVDIADAIREKNGTGGSIPALEFPDAIRSISGGGGSGGGSGGGGTAIVHKWMMVDEFQAKEMNPVNIGDVLLHRVPRYTILISSFEEVTA